MATLEDELKDLKEKNNELAQKVQYWKMTAAQRDDEKLALMKEINELRLKLSRIRNTGGFQARKLDTALQGASEKAISYLVKASAEIAKSMDIAKEYIRDRQELDTQSPRWSAIGGTPTTEKSERVHRVPPMMMGGQSIQPVVALSRTVLNTSNPRTAPIPNQNRSLTERAVPMHMLQDVYIPLTRIDVSDLPNNNMDTDPETNNADDSVADLGLDDDNGSDESDGHISEEDHEYDASKLQPVQEEPEVRRSMYPVRELPIRNLRLHINPRYEHEDRIWNLEQARRREERERLASQRASQRDSQRESQQESQKDSPQGFQQDSQQASQQDNQQASQQDNRQAKKQNSQQAKQQDSQQAKQQDSQQAKQQESHQAKQQDSQQATQQNSEKVNQQDRQKANKSDTQRGSQGDPLEGPSWLLDETPPDPKDSTPKSRMTLEPDSTTELEDSARKAADTSSEEVQDNTEVQMESSPLPAREFSPTVRRRKRTSSPPALATPRQHHYSPRPASTRRNSTSGRVLKVLVAKMRLDGSDGLTSSPPKRARSPSQHPLIAFDAPSPNGATDSRVIVSESRNTPPDNEITIVSDTRTRSGHDSHEDQQVGRVDGQESDTRRSQPSQEHTARGRTNEQERKQDGRDSHQRGRATRQERASSQRGQPGSHDSRSSQRGQPGLHDSRSSQRSQPGAHDSDSGSGGAGDSVCEGRTRRARKAVTYKEKPLNRKMRR